MLQIALPHWFINDDSAPVKSFVWLLDGIELKTQGHYLLGDGAAYFAGLQLYNGSVHWTETEKRECVSRGSGVGPPWANLHPPLIQQPHTSAV